MAGRKLKDFFWSAFALLIHLLDTLSLLFAKSKSLERTPLKKILVVRLDAIGDFVLWLDAAKEIRQLYPSDRYRITLLGNRLWTTLAERLPWFDEIISLERKRFFSDPAYRYLIFRRLRKMGFDVVLQPTFSREFLYGDSIVRFSGARERIGSGGDCSNQVPFLKRISDRWYTRLTPASKEPLMELERNTEFLRGLARTDFKTSIPEFPGTPAILPLIEERAGRDYYILFPGAMVSLRKWPAERFAEIAMRLFRETGWTGAICGGPEDRKLGERICHLAGVPVLNLAGQTSLPELVSRIATARLLVGNETGAIHIAVAVSTPSVCILGGGHYGRFLPYPTGVENGSPLPVAVVHRMECFHCHWKCIYHVEPGDPAPCVRDITENAVWEAVRKLLPEADIPVPSSENETC